MARSFTLLVFDWDGTVMDSTALIVRALQAACRDVGVVEPSAERARHVIGLSLSEAIASLAPDASVEMIERISDRYRMHFLAGGESLVLFDGMRDLIERLHAQGVVLAVATGKARRGLDHVLALSGLAEFFKATRCADESFSKPHPAMLFELLDQLMVEPARCLMIGDTTHDLQMAANAGVAALAVSYGAHPIDVLQQEKSLAIVHDVPGLEAWLQCNA